MRHNERRIGQRNTCKLFIVPVNKPMELYAECFDGLCHGRGYDNTVHKLIICSDIAVLLALSLQNCCQKHHPQLQYLQIDPSALRKCGQDLQVPMLKNCVLTPWQITILPQ